MTENQKPTMAAGLGVLWRRRNLLWWLFAVNLVLGGLGTLPAARQLHNLLRHSLAGEPLFKGFDLGMFYELLRVPEAALFRFRNGSYVTAGLFALFMLFASGGILQSYRQDRRLNTGEFFAASGAFLWRFVRLAVISGILFALLGNLYLAVDEGADYLGDKAVADQVGFFVWLFGVVVLILVAIFVRLWFDIAKVRAVAQDERRMVQNALKSFDIARQKLGSLLWLYVRISLAAWIITLIAFVVWTKVPPTAIWATFILLELVVLVQLASRLWQLAAVTVWYQQHFPVVQTLYEEVVEPERQLSLYPETELPPADA